ncbi:hypothetical protein F5Y14DRAFT_422900 [Nemania sp. NC0429]|nr:hypothetical protein F5Y14DRAFT_422900 [Nemania sp. NC0429]
MTSSNAALTNEGRAAAAATTASPPPATTTNPPSPSPRLRPDGDGGGGGDGSQDRYGDGDGEGAGDTAAPDVVAVAVATTSSALNESANETANETAHESTDAPPPTIIPPDTTDELRADAPQTPPAIDISDQPRLDPLSDEPNIDVPIPSPPTVSPLSTPAATHVNVDDCFPDDPATRLIPDLPPLSLARDASTFHGGNFGPAQLGMHRALSAPDAMELDEPFALDYTSYRRRSQVEAIATTDPDPHGADYAHGILSGMRLSQGSIDPSAYIMNLAAQATLFQEHAPPAIHPSAVSLHSYTQESDVIAGSAEPTSTNGSQKLESFARIEFADSTFQLTTYAVIIGRDKQAMEQARADEKREATYRRKCEENERNGLPPPTPMMHDRGKFSKSYVSEEGGMLGPEHSDGEDVKPAKRRRPSLAAPPADGEDNAPGSHAQSNRQYVSHTPGAAAVDLGALQPSPGHIPFIGIHSPGPDIASKTRGISRQHLKIQFNKKRGVFEGIALHKNGFFCEDVLYGLDQPATLRSGDRLQIKDVEFFFVINGVQNGMSGGEDEDVASNKRMSVGGKEMSLDFEHSDHENFRDTSEELSDVENVATPAVESERDEAEPERTPLPTTASVATAGPRSALKPEPEIAETHSIGIEERRLAEIVKPQLNMLGDLGDLGDLPPEFAMPEIPKRRGPGRPPKDGIMSKRERRELKKQMQETSKKTLPQDPQEEKTKRPVGRPRKNPLPEDGERPEKRKYNKKKREDGEEASDVEKRSKEKKDKKFRPKSPPLDLRIEDYTQEQLQKPTKNYGVLIDEALTNGPPDGLTLKQIYKRITARYPWFFFSAETKGWESSVRHNLIGNEAFKKNEETGLWSRVPGVELDAGKKRKASSPDRLFGPSHLHSHLSNPSYYQTSPYANPGNITYAHGLPNFSTEQKHTQSGQPSTGQNSQLHTTPSQPTTQPVFGAHVPAPAQLPPGYGSLALPRPTNTPQQSTYSSPYARPPPPPPSNPPVKVEINQANGQTPAPSSTAPPTGTTQQPQPKPTPSNAEPKEQLSPEIERAIMQFSANMLNVISKQTPHATIIIEAAANRVRGLPVQKRVPGFDSVENTLVSAMQGMIRDMKQKYPSTSTSPAPTAPAPQPAPQPAPAYLTPSPAPPNTVEVEIQRRLRNFRDSMVAALKTKTEKAEIIVDSAINRARGLPHAGKISGWEEADKLMVKSVTQIIAEVRSAHNLKLQNASPAPTTQIRGLVPQPLQPVLRPEPSASPASAQTPNTTIAPHMPSTNGIPASPYTSSAHPSISSTQNSNSPAMARPSMPLPRPAPVALTRPPTTGPMARPTVFHKEASTAPTIATPTVPPIPRPNVSSPAPPSAGVLDQITSQKRFTDDPFHKSQGTNSAITASSYTSSATASSINIAKASAMSTSNSLSAVNNIPSSTVASSAASNAPNTQTLKAVVGSTSNTPVGHSGSLAYNPTNVPSISSASNPASNPANNVSISAPNLPVGNAPGIFSKSGGAENLSSSTMSDHTRTISSTANVVATKSNAAGNIGGGIPTAATGHIPSSTTGNSDSSSIPKPGAAEIVNHTTAVTNPAETILGANARLAPGYAQGSTTNTSTSVPTSTTNISQVGGTAGAQNNQSVADSARRSVENEKSMPSMSAAMTHHEPTAPKAPAPVHNMSGPAPPSAGVVDQIAGHKRAIDEGPGSSNVDQPEAKRLAITST